MLFLRRVTSGWARLLPVFLLGLLLAAGCKAPGYAVDFFIEQHYTQSYRPQESPRLYPPVASVPFTQRGTTVVLEAKASSRTLTFQDVRGASSSLPANAVTAAMGAEAFRVNCAVCHGSSGDGKGKAAPFFLGAQVTPPANYKDAAVIARTDGELFWIAVHGTSQIAQAPAGHMPGFGPLLTDDEVWALVRHVRTLQGR
ncbi:MAG: c-type cytochrome [Chloroflexi bacterium]|nr:c-type cytochrome [Chloroflexota bacterium]